MAHDPDPYRVLGLARGATLDEVKRAYRRLAKANHPDAAGEAALPRFLAIQAAYEQLLGPGAGAAGGRGTTSASRRPWDADPDRSDATRRAYGGRARTSPPGAQGTPPGSAGPAGPASSASGRPARPGPGTGSSSKPGAGPTGSTSSRSSRRRRSAPADRAGPPPSDTKRTARSGKSNKATLGSTSYDGVDAGEFEPDWRGASWYGTTSGTYWTLNPKEYADPRKHGPEYQARARRTARVGTDDGAPASTSGSTVPPAADGPSAAGPTHTTSSWWDSTAGAAGWAGASDAGPSAPPRPTADRASGGGAAPTAGAGFDLERSAASVGRLLFDERAGGTQGRIVRAIVGWIPIALAISWLIGEVTGCGRFAATCDGTTEPVVLGVQVLTLALLLVVPSLAVLTTIAAVTMFAASIIAAFTLYTTAETAEAVDLDARAATLGVLLLVAWTVGLILAIARRARAAPSTTRPVS